MRVPWCWFIVSVFYAVRLFGAQEYDSKQKDEQEVILWSAQGLSKAITMNYIYEEPLEPRVVSYAQFFHQESYFESDNSLTQFNPNNKALRAQQMQSLDALRCAVWKKDILSVVDCLDLEDVPVDSAIQNGYTGLQLACQKGDDLLADCFIRRNAKVNWKGYAGMPPIFFAAQSGSVKVLKSLLKTKELRVDFFDDNKNTALMHAAKAGHVHFVRALVASGADVLRRNHQGRTALEISLQQQKRIDEKIAREKDDSSSDEDAIDTEKKDDYAQVIAFLTTAELKASKEKQEEKKCNALARAEGFTVVRKPHLLYRSAYNGGTLHEPPQYTEGWSQWFKRVTRPYLPDLLS